MGVEGDDEMNCHVLDGWMCVCHSRFAVCQPSCHQRLLLDRSIDRLTLAMYSIEFNDGRKLVQTMWRFVEMRPSCVSSRSSSVANCRLVACSHLAKPLVVLYKSVPEGARVVVRNVELLAGLARDLGQRKVMRKVHAREEMVFNLENHL
jgi:hypothetical protein